MSVLNTADAVYVGGTLADAAYVGGEQVWSAAPDELFPGWTTGRVFQWSVDPSDFTVTNYDTITDGGQPALRHHTGGEFSEASVLTNATDIAAARVEFRYRAQPASGLDIQNIALKSQIRYQDANNYWQITRARGAGASWMSPVERVASSDVNHAALAGDSAMDNTDTTTYQTFRMDVFRDVLRAKEWFVGDSEPDWKDTFRFRPSFGFGGAVVTDADNTPETGQAGLRAMYGGIVQDVIVTELVPVSTTNLIVNPTFDPELLDSSGNPFFWGVNDTWTSETTGITELVTTTRMDGLSGPVLRVARSDTGVSAEGPMWQQSFYINPTITNPYYTRARATPSIGSAFPASINLSIKTKGTNLANTNVGTKLTARWVNYYFDDTGDLNMDDGPGGTGTDYHFAPGPNNGLGTWDWTQVTYTLPLYGTGTVLLRFDIGLHDQEATGELLFYDVKFEPVT